MFSQGPELKNMRLHNLGRLHDDNSAVLDRTRQSMGQGEWYLQNYHHSSSRGVMSVATQEVTVIPTDGYGVNRNVIDRESELKIGAVQTKPNVPIHPQSRPIVTVPYMGRGRGNPYTESLLIKSEAIRDKKSAATVTDSFFENQFIPMIPHLQENIQNPVHYVEELNDPSWVRGGAMSRNIVRDQLCHENAAFR
jgi:hypothetical protein